MKTNTLESASGAASEPVLRSTAEGGQSDGCHLHPFHRPPAVHGEKKMDKCDCERQGAKNSRRVLIGDIEGNLETVIEACPQCVRETLREDILGTTLYDMLGEESDRQFMEGAK